VYVRFEIVDLKDLSQRMAITQAEQRALTEAVPTALAIWTTTPGRCRRIAPWPYTRSWNTR